MIKNALSLIYGIAHGVATVVPGFSGGTLLVIFGCYDRVCEAMALDFKSIKKNFIFLVLFGVGTVAGILGAARVIMFFIERFPLWTYLLLATLILAGLPSIIKTATSKQKLKPICVIPFVLGATLIIGIFLAEQQSVFGGGVDGSIGMVRLVVCSAGSAVAAVIPGVSGSFMMVAFGIYETVTGALTNFDFNVLIPAGIGIVLGLVAGAKLIIFFLKRWRLMVYSAIIGMVSASSVMLIIDTITKYT